tara:strand:- start:3893 stop:4513 length:621 start_codon:yes stop_codon:yes gene_type:complete
MKDSINKALQWALIPALLVYVASLSLSGLAGIKGQLVLRDLAQTCGTPAGVGLLSNLGYLLWLAAAAVALFTAYSGQPGVRGKQYELLACGGWFSFILCIDDMFLLHDRYIGQTFLYVVYMVFAALIATRYRRQLMASRGELFLLAVALLGASIGIDQFQRDLPFKYETVQLVEEGAKFLGIATWVLYWWQASKQSLNNAQSRITS